MKYRLPYADTLRKEARSLRKLINTRADTRLSVVEVEKLIAHCLGFRDAAEHQKAVAEQPPANYTLMQWRSLDIQFAERLNKELPGMGGVSLRVVQSTLTLSEQSWHLNRPLTQYEMCLLIAPPEFKQGPIGLVLGERIVVDPEKALQYFLVLSGFQDTNSQALEAAIKDAESLCLDLGLAPGNNEDANGRTRLLDLFFILSKDMPVWQLKNRFKGLLRQYRSIYFALDSLPLESLDDPIHSHPEAAPLVYVWRCWKAGRKPDWKQFIGNFEQGVLKASGSDLERWQGPQKTLLINANHIDTAQGFLEGETYEKRPWPLQDFKPHRFAVTEPHWEQNTWLLGCVGSGVHRSMLTYLYPLMKSGRGGLLVDTEGDVNLYWLLHLLMTTLGRASDLTIISSLRGFDDPWSSKSLTALRNSVLNQYETSVETEMASALFELLDRKVLLEMSKTKDQNSLALQLINHITNELETIDFTGNNKWKILCIRYCRERLVSYQLWREVLNQWVIGFAETIEEHTALNPKLLATPDIDWEKAISQGKLIVCLESAMEKAVKTLEPCVQKLLNQYAETTKQLGEPGLLVTKGLCGGVQLSEAVCRRIQDPDFTWIACSREPAEMDHNLGNQTATPVFSRLLMHPSATDNPEKATKYVVGHHFDIPGIKAQKYWQTSNPGNFVYIDKRCSESFRLSFVDFFQDANQVICLSRPVSIE